MNAVKNITTNRLVYRESPDFKKGYGIINAVLHDLGQPDELLEVTVTQAEWEAELALQASEQPPSNDRLLELLTLRVQALEEAVSSFTGTLPPP